MTMNLHRASKKPDWEKLKARNRNYWQRLAARTNGIVTPGNVISALGFVLVLVGLVDIFNDQIFRGVALIVIGRILDVVDGILADKTGTKSPLGEAVDASIDKIEIAAAIPVLVVKSVLMPWQAVLIALQHIGNAIFTGIAKLRKAEIHPSTSGKHFTAAQWVAIAFYGLAEVLPQGISQVSFLLGAIAFTVSVLLGAKALYGYAKDALA
ncbi:MAG: hypothetical protein JWL85_891 [Candidatus Saccharibacteria bacterium]|nr:hypothetical protein [Candidatus Saccharibacteria bacterium]